MIFYNPKTTKAIGYLKGSFNDIEVYVEDAAGQSMWNRIIRRLLPEGVRFDSVTMLGGRDEVVSACRLDQVEDGRRRIYIIDSDLDFVLSKSKPRLKRLHRIHACDIENLLMGKNAVVQVAIEAGRCTDESSALQQLDVEGTILEFESDLRNIAIYYAVMEQLDARSKPSRPSVFKLTERDANGNLRLSKSKIYSHIAQLFRFLRTQFSLSDILNVRRIISGRVGRMPIKKVVSGKRFLLPLIWHRLRRSCGCSLSFEQLCIRLAGDFDPTTDGHLRRAISSL